MKVERVVIGKQYETCDNYEEFKRIVNLKKINVNTVEAGNKISIENGLYFIVLWPSSANMISDNAINNNSLVVKLVYKNFSMFFTGDIEEIAEKTILSKYAGKNEILKSDLLKVAHHGSKTSSTKEFISSVEPQYAVIGVRKDKKFGHPADETIKILQDRNVKIYRTDFLGEIWIRANAISIQMNGFLDSS